MLRASRSRGVIQFCSEGLLALLGWERAGRGQEVADAQLRWEMTVVWLGCDRSADAEALGS